MALSGCDKAVCMFWNAAVSVCLSVFALVYVVEHTEI